MCIACSNYASQTQNLSIQEEECSINNSFAVSIVSLGAAHSSLLQQLNKDKPEGSNAVQVEAPASSCPLHLLCALLASAM